MLCKNPFKRRLDKLKYAKGVDVTVHPCGQCLPCRINKARTWTHRLLLEQAVTGDSAFVTLTYDDQHLPTDLSLQPNELSKFIKRFRRAIEPRKIRYFAVGEYGDQSWRPHYHLALFNASEWDTHVVNNCWGRGFVQVGDLNKDSARYITGYVTKKMTSKNDHRLDGRTPEFMRCSKQNGGLGIDAIRQIAKKLYSDAFFQKRILRELQYGKSKLPLGRYLVKKLADHLGIDNQEFINEYWSHHHELVGNLSDEFEFYKKLEAEFGPKRLSQEKKQKLFKSKRII